MRDFPRTEARSITLDQHDASLIVGSKRFASTAGFKAAVLRLSLSLTHSSTGKA
jgi:mannose-6-phosphate isomerase class I